MNGPPGWLRKTDDGAEDRVRDREIRAVGAVEVASCHVARVRAAGAEACARDEPAVVGLAQQDLDHVALKPATAMSVRPSPLKSPPAIPPGLPATEIGAPSTLNVPLLCCNSTLIELEL